MLKLLNKFIYILKNILLPFTFIATMYIIIFMFKRLDKQMFGEDFLELLMIVLPYLLLLILLILNSVLKCKNIQNNFFYNIVSFMVALTITVFIYRSLFDKNMILWHKYGYNINFNYFADQIASIKVMLYGLSIANICLIINNYLGKEKIKTNE